MEFYVLLEINLNENFMIPLREMLFMIQDSLEHIDVVLSGRYDLLTHITVLDVLLISSYNESYLGFAWFLLADYFPILLTDYSFILFQVKRVLGIVVIVIFVIPFVYLICTFSVVPPPVSGPHWFEPIFDAFFRYKFIKFYLKSLLFIIFGKDTF